MDDIGVVPTLNLEETSSTKPGAVIIATKGESGDASAAIANIPGEEIDLAASYDGHTIETVIKSGIALPNSDETFQIIDVNDKLLVSDGMLKFCSNLQLKC